MFYSHSFLAKKSPLGTVWIAAHLERRIKKPQVDAIDISSNAECIMFPEVPIALRLSGHLLLGLVRIYSWKVNYLFQDCNRMMTNIRMTVASVQVNLPTEADHAPFESITLPETFELDALVLDDYHMDGPDNHQNNHEEITLTDEQSSGHGHYAAFFIDEQRRGDLSANLEMRNLSAGPMEEDVLPPFQDGLDAIATPILNPSPFEDPGSNNQVNDSFQNVDVNNSAQEYPEIEVMREAVHNFEPVSLVELDSSNAVTPHESSAPVTMGKGSLSPITEDVMPPGEESLPSASHSIALGALADDSNILNRGIASDQPLPDLELQPSPSVREQRAKRKRTKQLYDTKIVLTNEEMKSQLEDCTRLVAKRKKAPYTALDVWKFHRKHLKEQVLHEPLLTGMCGILRETFEKSFPLSGGDSSRLEVSPSISHHDSVNDFTIEPEQQAEMDVELQQQINLNGAPEQPRFDIQIEENIAEIVPSPSAAGDAAPEQPRFDMQVEENMTEIIPSPSGREDSAPEQPRFDIQTENMTEMMPSPSGVGDVTPFDTTTVGSDFHRTFETHIPPTVESFARYESVSVAPGVSANTPKIPSGLMSAQEDFAFLDESNASSGYQESETGNFSARTRAVADYFKSHSPSQIQDSDPGVFSLNSILEGKTRKQCARMFFESLVLKNYGFIDVQQQEPYGDIRISPMPALFSSKF